MSSNELDVGSWIRARRAADRRLIDGDQFVEMFEALDAVVCAGITLAPIEITVEGFGEDIVDERAFAGAADAGDADERAERDFGGRRF